MENDNHKTEWDFRTERPDQWLKNEINHRKMVINKQILEIMLVALFGVLIFSLSYFKLIQGETIAAILGTMVGYCFEHWRNKKEL